VEFEGTQYSSSRRNDFNAFRIRSFVKSKADCLIEIERCSLELAVFVTRGSVRHVFRYWLLFSDRFPWFSSGKHVLVSKNPSMPVAEPNKSMPVVEEIGARTVHKWTREAQADGRMFSSRLQHLLRSSDPKVSVTHAAEFNR
jgi:hypothetical protein